MSLPLSGLKILITRAKKQASDLADRLAALGATPLVLPSIEIVPPFDLAPLTTAKAEISKYDWVVFTSVNGVQSLANTHGLGDKKLAAVGPASAAELAKIARHPDAIPAEYTSDHLPDTLGDIAGMRILLPQGDLARQSLADELRKRGATVDCVQTYRTISDDHSDLPASAPDLITFTSSSGVLATHERLCGAGLLSWLTQAPLISIGPVTAQTIRSLGFEVAAESTDHTIPGLVETVITFHQSQNTKGANH